MRSLLMGASRVEARADDGQPAFNDEGRIVADLLAGRLR
jgi:hypothetical protein